MKKILLLVLAIVLLGGCTQTAYKQYGNKYPSKVGYSDFQIGKNKYKVTYTGGVYDDGNKVVEFAYRRAKELCKEKGFSDYEIANTESASNKVNYVNARNNKSQKVYMLDVTCK